MPKSELIVVPATGAGHVGAALELAKLLAEREDRLSVSVLIIQTPSDSMISNYIDAFLAATDSDRVRIRHLPKIDHCDQFSIIEDHKTVIREMVSKLIETELKFQSKQLAGFILDMFCSTVIDVANEFNVPSYIFYTSGAAFLKFHMHLAYLNDVELLDMAKPKDSNAEISVPSLAAPFPVRLMPPALSHDQWRPLLVGNARRFGEARGVIVNTFEELEPHALKAISHGGGPPVYPVGPILSLWDVGSNGSSEEVIQWLDQQPSCSVVFLCFGSRGSFGREQIEETAHGLERSGHRFLWSLRKSPADDNPDGLPTEYSHAGEVLPEKFLERTTGIGMVIGWAPQAVVLAHRSIGGFVSHCGWNSILESIWFGVPLAAWPLYSEQHFNAFEMAVELGLAVKIALDYRKESGIVVRREEIEAGIRNLMAQDSETRKKVSRMSDTCRRVGQVDGSSFTYLGHFLRDAIENGPRRGSC